ncbi:uncharacterized protein LOC128181218 [Crassostrea angulata]|uniref:uncharacterized protein LOC128181218 n=1 Tax=Magallana angulata TaxID=2784310 RepID=UPI0022B1F968|nr:uncharacterized protein LOC128181218 [Crassostrea angulata]XP_052705490.1 uncharacterized protein LOC128181218 [Crassostrea angulata]
MTDRCATEQKVNDILARDIDHAVHSFKCSVHPLLQFSDVCIEEIFNIEQELCFKFPGYTHSLREPFILFLLKSVSKLFYKDGTGDPNILQVYMKNHGVENIPIVNIRGNRFNVLFYNAAGTFFMHKHILQYFYSLKSSYNFIQNFIVLCLQNKTFLTLLRALGIICKIITEPYFVKATEVGNILLMGSVFQRLLYVLDLLVENPILALNNEVSLFYGPCFYDGVFDFLLKTSLNNDLTCVFIKCLCSVLKSKVSKLFYEFLKGGKYFNVHQGDLPECNSCSTNNICLERLMGRLDFKLKAASTSTVNSIESCILYSNNKTENWLKDKDPKEQQEIIDSARSQNRVFMKKDRERQEELFIKQTKILEQKENEAKRKKERKVNQIDKAIEDMRTVGLWESEEKIKEEVEKLRTKKEKMESLKKQINIYKKVFEIDKNFKELLQFSSKGKIYDISKLQQNLTKLIMLRRNTPKYKASDLVGKAIIHTWTLENGENKEYEGEIRGFEDGVFKVVYWDDKEKKEGNEFELTEREINIDIQEGNLFIKDTTNLDHCYSTF